MQNNKAYKLQSLIGIEGNRNLKTANQSSPDKPYTLKKAFSGTGFILQLTEFQGLFKFRLFQPLKQVFQRNRLIE